MFLNKPTRLMQRTESASNANANGKQKKLPFNSLTSGVFVCLTISSVFTQIWHHETSLKSKKRSWSQKDTDMINRQKIFFFFFFWVIHPNPQYYMTVEYR